MGGYNAFQLYFKHTQLWSRASIQCPIAVTINPWSSRAEIDRYIQQNPGTSRFAVNRMLAMSRRFYPDLASFQQDDPIEQSRNFAQRMPPMYLSCGDRDFFGFFGGNQIIAQRALSNNAPVQWQAIAGGSHCAIDVGRMAGFYRRPGV